jgi:hypothetical protein
MVSDNGLIILSMAAVVCSIVIAACVVAVFKKRSDNEKYTPEKVKKSATLGQVDAIEGLKDSVAETIKFYKSELGERDIIIKKLRNSLNYYKGHADDVQEEEEDDQQEPKGKAPDGLTPEILNARKALVKEHLAKNINPVLMQFPVIDNVINEIASDPDFEGLLKSFIASGGNKNQSAAQEADASYL